MDILSDIFWLVFLGLIIVVIRFQQHREKLIKDGKAAYFVKIAASGKGSVYHKLSCGRCLAYYEITETEARNRGYAPCSVCGGKATFRMITR